MNLSKQELVSLASKLKLKKDVLARMSKKDLIQFMTGVEIDKCSKKKINQANQRLEECVAAVRLRVKEEEPRTIGDSPRDPSRIVIERESPRDIPRMGVSPRCVIERDAPRFDTSPRLEGTEIRIEPRFENRFEPRQVDVNPALDRLANDISELRVTTSQLNQKISACCDELEQETLRHEQVSNAKHSQLDNELSTLERQVDQLNDNIRQIRERDNEFEQRVRETFSQENEKLLFQNFQEARRAAREEIDERIDDTATLLAQKLSEETSQQALDAANRAVQNVLDNSDVVSAAVDSAFERRLTSSVRELLSTGLDEIVVPELERLALAEQSATQELERIRSSLSSFTSLELELNNVELSLQSTEQNVENVQRSVEEQEERLIRQTERVQQLDTNVGVLRAGLEDLRQYWSLDVVERVEAAINQQNAMTEPQVRRIIANDPGLAGRLDTLDTELRAVQQQDRDYHDEFRDQIRRRLQEQNISFDDRIRELQEQNVSLDGRILQVTDNISQVREYVDTVIRDRQQTLDNRLVLLATNESVDALANTVAEERETQIALVNQNLRRFEQELNANTSLVNEVTTIVSRNEVNVMAVNDRYNTLDDRVVQYQQQVDGYNDTVARFTGSLEDFTQQLEFYRQQVTTVRQEILDAEERTQARSQEFQEQVQLSIENVRQTVQAIEQPQTRLRLDQRDMSQAFRATRTRLERRMAQIIDNFRQVRNAVNQQLQENTDNINALITQQEQDRAQREDEQARREEDRERQEARDREQRRNRILAIEDAPSNDNRIDELQRDITNIQRRLETLEQTVDVRIEARLRLLSQQLSQSVPGGSPLKRRRIR